MGAVSSPCAVQERMYVWTARAVFLKDHASADPTFANMSHIPVSGSAVG